MTSDKAPATMDRAVEVLTGIAVNRQEVRHALAGLRVEERSLRHSRSKILGWFSRCNQSIVIICTDFIQCLFQGLNRSDQRAAAHVCYPAA